MLHRFHKAGLRAGSDLQAAADAVECLMMGAVDRETAIPAGEERTLLRPDQVGEIGVILRRAGVERDQVPADILEQCAAQSYIEDLKAPADAEEPGLPAAR